MYSHCMLLQSAVQCYSMLWLYTVIMYNKNPAFWLHTNPSKLCNFYCRCRLSFLYNKICSLVNADRLFKRNDNQPVNKLYRDCMWARSLWYDPLKKDHTKLETLRTSSLVDTTTVPWRHESMSLAGMFWRRSVRKRWYNDSTSANSSCGNGSSSLPVDTSLVILTSNAPSTSDSHARSGARADKCASNNLTTASIVFSGKYFIHWRIPDRLQAAADRRLTTFDIFLLTQLSKWHTSHLDDSLTRRITSHVFCLHGHVSNFVGKKRGADF